MRIIRNEILASSLSITVSAEEFRKVAPGWTRLDTARKFLEDIGIEVNERIVMQVIPHGGQMTIRLMDAE